MRCPGSGYVPPAPVPEMACPDCGRVMKVVRGGLYPHGDHQPCPDCGSVSRSHHQADHATECGYCLWCRLCRPCDLGAVGVCTCGAPCTCSIPACGFSFCLPGFHPDPAARRAIERAEGLARKRLLGIWAERTAVPVRGVPVQAVEAVQQ